MSDWPAVPENAPEPRPDRRDALPVWVVALLVLFFAMRIYSLAIAPRLHSATVPHVSQSLSGGIDDAAMQALVTASISAKQAYLSSLGKAAAAAGPDRKALREALKAADTLQTKTHNSPSAARRVILLRFLLDQPPLAVGRNGLDPLAAFRAPSLAGLSASDKAQYVAEGRLWETIFRGGRQSPGQIAALRARIRAIPNIAWWQYPALEALYQTQGDVKDAARAAHQAQTRALATLAPLALLVLLGGGLFLLGILLLGYFAVRAYQARRDVPPSSRLPELWPTIPDPVPANERRLRAGDLLGVFVIYLMLPDVIGALLTGIGGPHGAHVRGLLTPYRARLHGLSVTDQTALMVVLEAAAYLITALIPIGILLLIARRRGASVGLELGWNSRRFGWNLLYGALGYAVGLPLMLLAAELGPNIFRHAPEPTNPAIVLLAGAGAWWVKLILILLATVAAPLTEEFLFRGVFFNAAKLRVGVWPAIVLTGLVFGFVHPVGLGEMLPLAVLGGVFAWLAQTRKSLVPSMLAHCMQNAAATLFLLSILSG